MTSFLTAGTQSLYLVFILGRVEVEYVDPQWLAEQGFACHLWMNATLNHIPVLVP